MIAIIAHVTLIAYFVANSYMVVNYRANRYKTDQALVCYWNFWVDWFSFFWFDLVANTRFVKK